MQRSQFSCSVLALFLLTGAVVAGGSEPEIAGFDKLSKEKGLFKKTLVNPEADFSSYNGLYQEPMRLLFRRKAASDPSAETGSLIRNHDSGSSVPDQEDRARFGEVVTTAIKEVLGNGESFELVEEPGPGTLILQASVLDLDSNIPIRSQGETELRGKLIGQGTIVFDLIDAETGAIQARLSERRKILRSSKDGPADFAIVWAEVRRWARSAASDLLQELEKARREDLGST